MGLGPVTADVTDKYAQNFPTEEEALTTQVPPPQVGST